VTTANTRTRSTNAPRLSGSLTALITPFNQGTVDVAALRSLVEFQIREGTAGLVPCGTTGETATMTQAEQDLVISTVVEQTNGRIPVIAGTGSNSTQTTIERTRRAAELGADAALIVTPYYNKPTQSGLFAHFTAIADATDLPIVLYNVPGRTSVNMLPETVVRLAEIPTIIGIKEASGVLDQASQIALEAPSDFIILSGDDSLTLPIMGVGGQGVISVVSNIAPGAVAELTAACLAGDYATARQHHLALFDLCRAMFVETNPVPVKTAAAILGLCREDVRLPLAPLSESSRHRVASALNAFLSTRDRAVAA
jgi:4-hydroxy-tetrahydrodipicolinate synthase